MTLILHARHDVNVIGLLGTEATAPLIGTTIVDVLKDHFAVNLLSSRPPLKNQLIHAVHEQDLPFDPALISLQSRDLAPISILTDVIGYKDRPYYKSVPNSFIKLAYSMFEADALPRHWVWVLNKLFDAVIVPDQALIDIYKT